MVFITLCESIIVDRCLPFIGKIFGQELHLERYVLVHKQFFLNWLTVKKALEVSVKMLNEFRIINCFKSK